MVAGVVCTTIVSVGSHHSNMKKFGLNNAGRDSCKLDRLKLGIGIGVCVVVDGKECRFNCFCALVVVGIASHTINGHGEAQGKVLFILFDGNLLQILEHIGNEMNQNALEWVKSRAFGTFCETYFELVFKDSLFSHHLKMIFGIEKSGKAMTA